MIVAGRDERWHHSTPMAALLAIESRVDRVSVHRRGAIVTRVATLPAQPPASVKIGPLPFGIDDGSVRAAVRSEGSLNAIDVRVVLDVPGADARLAPARPEELIAAEREVAEIRARVQARSAALQRFETIGVIARPSGRPGREPPPSPLAARRALLAWRDEAIAKLDEELERERIALEDASRKLADLRERDRRASDERRAEPDELRKAVVLGLRGDASGQAVVEVSYRIEAARWAPTYVLRLDRDWTRASLDVRALIAQRSGEDWRDVELTLSTAELHGWAELPELPSIRIGRQQPPPPRSGWRPAPDDGDALFEDFDASAPSPRETVERAASAKRTGGASGPALAAAAPGAFPPPPIGAPMPMAPMSTSAPVTRAFAPPPQAFHAKSAPVFSGLGEAIGAASEVAHELALLGDAVAPNRPAVVRARDEMLDYGRLRLAAAHEPQRGKLVLRTRDDEGAHELACAVDLRQAEARERERTETLLGAKLPGRFVVPPAPSGFDYAYPAHARVHVPSDGGFHSLAIAEHDGPVRLRFVVVPRESRDAFRFLAFDNPLDAPLLPGPVDVYAGGHFVSTVPIEEPIVPRGLLELGLGVDQRLKVARNTRYQERSAGLMRGRLELAHEIAVDLENHLSTDATIEVRERVPVTREGDDEIEVREVDVVPRWEEWEPPEYPLRGGRRWVLTLAPGQKQSLVARYEVRIASKNELVGGNRRE